MNGATERRGTLGTQTGLASLVLAELGSVVAIAQSRGQGPEPICTTAKVLLQPWTSAPPAEPGAARVTERPLEPGPRSWPEGPALLWPPPTLAAASTRSWPGAGKDTVLTTAISGHTGLIGIQNY